MIFLRVERMSLKSKKRIKLKFNINNSKRQEKYENFIIWNNKCWKNNFFVYNKVRIVFSNYK